MQLAAAEQRADSQVRSALEAQLEQLRSTHATQLAALRDELAANQRQLQELKELVLHHIWNADISSRFCRFREQMVNFLFLFNSSYQELTLARQQLQDDYDKLKREEADKSAKLKELMLVSRSPRRGLDKAEKEVANQQMVLKEEGDFKDFILSPKREKLGFTGLEIEKASAREEKSLSAIPKSPARLACNIHPLQLHLLISVTMILLTHRYPQIVVLV